MNVDKCISFYNPNAFNGVLFLYREPNAPDDTPEEAFAGNKKWIEDVICGRSRAEYLNLTRRVRSVTKTHKRFIEIMAAHSRDFSRELAANPCI